jgi:glycosyltransferase involved in cell wall biosynthesis
MANEHGIIRPVFRERNLGVTANRDLAVRQADGDFVATLDGDDSHLPGKLAAESAAIERTSAPVAYSDQRILYVQTGKTVVEHLASFATVDKGERVRWFIVSQAPVPRDMLLAKDLHIRMGGFRSEGEPYEDWDYKIRLAAAAESWAYSGVEGVVHRVHSGGISQISAFRHGVKQLIVMRSNRDLIRREVGSVFYYGFSIRIVAKATKWQTKSWHWQTKRWLRGLKAGL